MKFLVLCVVAFFAPNLLDDGTPRAPVPQFEDRQALPAEQAPIAGPAEPGDPDQRRILRRRPARPDGLFARIRTWLQDRRSARQERDRTAPRQRRGRRGDRQDVDQAPPAPDRQVPEFRPPSRSQGPDPGRTTWPRSNWQGPT